MEYNMYATTPWPLISELDMSQCLVIMVHLVWYINSRSNRNSNLGACHVPFHTCLYLEFLEETMMKIKGACISMAHCFCLLK